MRPLSAEFGVLNAADGSARLALGEDHHELKKLLAVLSLVLRKLH